MYSEIQHNNLYISVSRQNVCPKELAIVMTLVSKTTFLNPLRGGTFSNLIRYGDIPSSHGDIPVVSYQLYEVESTNTFFRVLLFFYPLGAYLMLLQVSEMQVYSCTFFKIGFSLDANTQSRMGFIDALQLIPTIYFSFPFSALQLIEQNCSANNFADNFQLVCSVSLNQYTKVKPACK